MAFKLGDTDFTWVRLKADRELGNLPGIFTTEAEWRVRGHNVADLGAASVSEIRQRKGPVPIPQRLDLLLNLHTPREIQIVQIPPQQFIRNPPVVVAADFSDPHPAEWIESLDAAGRALLAIGPEGHEDFATLYDWQQTWSIIVIGVAKALRDDGVGIVAPHT